jgi:hypothetical protein
MSCTLKRHIDLVVFGIETQIVKVFKIFNNTKIFRPSHGRSHGVTDVMDQHQDVWNIVCTERACLCKADDPVNRSQLPISCLKWATATTQAVLLFTECFRV